MKNDIAYGKITIRAQRYDIDTTGLHEKLALCTGFNQLNEQVTAWYSQISNPKHEIIVERIDTLFLRGPLTERQGESKYILHDTILDVFRHFNNIPTRGEYTPTRTGILFNSIWARRVNMRDIRSLLYQSDVEEMCLSLR